MRNVWTALPSSFAFRRMSNEHPPNNQVPERYFGFDSGPIDYTITSLGHEIGMKTEYPRSSLQKYVIKLRKSKNKVMKSKSAVPAPEATARSCRD